MPHYTEALHTPDNNDEKKQNRKVNNSIGKHNNKHIFKNNGQYGVFYTHDKVNYRIPPFVSDDKIDFELVKNYIVYKNEMKQKYGNDTIEKPTVTLSESD